MNTDRPEPRWLNQPLVMAMHADQIRQHGGDLGLRDQGMLESALTRAYNRWHYDTDADIHALAAAYGFGLANNHAFIDGNKRVAFISMYVFLGLNGYRLIAEEPEVVLLMLDVASRKLGEIELSQWLRDHTQSV